METCAATSTAQVSGTHFLCLTHQMTVCAERQVMKLVGKHLVESPVRKDPVTCAEKAKEGVFDMEAEMAQIE